MELGWIRDVGGGFRLRRGPTSLTASVGALKQEIFAPGTAIYVITVWEVPCEPKAKVTEDYLSKS
jgi:hypothetical protein